MAASAAIDGGWQARVRGALSLSACASSLATRIRDGGVGERSWDAVLDAPPPLHHTADTSLMLALSDHVARNGGDIDCRTLVADFAAQWRQNPRIGYSPAVASLLRHSSDGSGWIAVLRAVQPAEPGIAFSWVLPIGLLPRLELGAVAARARRAAAAVDEHPLTLDGAGIYAAAISSTAHARQGEPDAHTLIRTIGETAHCAAFFTALAQVPTLVDRHATAEQANAVLGLHHGALSAVPMALTAFLLHPHQPRQAVRFALAALPDATAAAAMAAGLCGAWTGESALPANWGIHLESATRLRTVATALALLPPPASG